MTGSHAGAWVTIAAIVFELSAWEEGGGPDSKTGGPKTARYTLPEGACQPLSFDAIRARRSPWNVAPSSS